MHAKKAKKLAWLSIAPFGGPVVPLVYEKVKQFLPSTFTERWSIILVYFKVSEK
jgi:hypothetical protein